MTHRRLAPLVLAVAACQAGPRSPSHQAAAEPLRVVANDYAYGKAFDTLQAGWHAFRVVNEGRQPHMAVFARLDSGKTLADVVAAIKSKTPASWVREVGGINAVLPGDSLTSALDLPAGSYVIACFVVDSSGKYHILDGMISTFTVADTGLPAIPEPVGSDTVGLTSFRITFTAPPTAGPHVYRVENVDTTAMNHDFVLVRLLAGKSRQDVFDWMTTMRGPAPFTVAGATTGMAPGLHDFVWVDLVPGDYLALCLMSAPDGKRHYEHGMVANFSVAN